MAASQRGNKQWSKSKSKSKSKKMNLTTTIIAPENLITITVNGIEKKMPKGKNLLKALLDEGIYVPHYCWHPSLSVAGNCRLCLIEIEGQPRPSVSCNMTCTEGLKIKTEGPMVEDSRKGMMEFLLVNHPLDCPICDRGGECMLQRYSMEYGTGHARTIDDRRRFEKPQFDPLIDIERNRCIMCTRCVRFMDEVAGHHTLGVFGRGNRNYIGTFGNGPVSSNFSGNIIDVCPVGCLTSKPFRFSARSWELQQVTTTCSLCSAGCPTTAWLRDGKLMRMTPPARKYNGQYTIDEDTTQFICNEGRFGNYYANHPDRLTRALVREGDSQKPVSLNDAILKSVDWLKQAAQAGPEKVAILCGSRQTNEEYYLLSRLARSVLGTNQIDWRLDFTSPRAAQAVADALAGSDGDLALLEAKGYPVTLVVGADLLETAPVIGLKIKEAARLRHTKLAILDSRLDGWLSEQASASAVASPDKLTSNVSAIAEGLAETAALASDLKPIRDLLASSEKGLIVLGMDTAGGEIAAELLPAIFALLARLGAGWKFLPVFRARNAKGATSAGAQSDRLPAGEIGSDTARNRMAELWGTLKGDSQPGPSAPEILRRAAEGQIQTLLLHRCDELVHHPQRELIGKALSATPNVIVMDVFPSWITERATVVLPGALFFETEGSLVSADGTFQSFTRGNQPPGDAGEDWRILAAISERLGASGAYERAGQIFKELLQCWKVAPPFALEDLKLEGPGAESPQRPQSLIRTKARPNFKLHSGVRELHGTGAPEIQGLAPDGKLCLLWHNAVQGSDHLGSHSTQFDERRPEAAMELHPLDAKERGFKEGDRARIKGCRVEAKIVLNESLARGFAYGAANVLGLELADNASVLPEVELTKAGD